MKWKTFIITASLFLLGHTAYAKSFELDKDKSKITYALTKFGIPFKKKPLPAEGQIELENSSLSSLNLKARFTSKNPLFRKLISIEKYPYFSFYSNLKNPILLLQDSELPDLTGYLTFHGITKKVNVTKLRCKKSENIISLTGFLNIKMTDFGIEPPRILFIKIDDAISTKIELYSSIL